MAFELARDLVAFYARPEQGSHIVQVQPPSIITPAQRVKEVAEFRAVGLFSL